MKFLCIVSVCLFGLTLYSCNDEKDVAGPGAWVSSEAIGTYPGDTVTIEGQASSSVGLKEVRLECAAWDINRSYDLGGQKPKVWNYSYGVCVPYDAQFPQTLTVTTVNVDGQENVKEIPLTYNPTTEQPVISGLQDEIAVDYDTSLRSATLKLNFGVSAVGVLNYATISIPQLSVEDRFDLSGRGHSIESQYTITECGTYTMTVTVADRCGNITSKDYTIVVMPKENEDEVADYDRMYAFTNEPEANYIYGYYMYMQRMDAYCYQVLVYAPTDDTEFFFSPTMETNGERKFGASPYVATKIISKQSEPGYVNGYKPGRGYWGLWVNVKDQTISKWTLDTAEGDKSTLYYSADRNGWSFTAMQQGAGECQKTADITIYAGNQYFCFATTTDWTHIWRIWNDNNELAGWWFSEDGSGSGATLPTISSNVNATITFDTLTKWCFIKKK